MSEFEEWEKQRAVHSTMFTRERRSAFEAGQRTLHQEVKDVIDAAIGMIINNEISGDAGNMFRLISAVKKYEEANDAT